MKPFKEMKLGFTLDNWQKEVLRADGNICLCNGRQTGKTEVISIKTTEWAVDHPKNNIMIISVTEDQAMLVLTKILCYLVDNYKYLISKGKHKPTRHKVTLTNGSTIMTKAVGATGVGIRGHTIHILVGDEAAYIDDVIWDAATPMMLTTGGQIWLLSTPNTMNGYFYKAYTEAGMGFKIFHHTSEEVADARKEPTRTIMLEYLEREKVRKTQLEYAQQYLAQFLEELGQFFPDKLIKERQVVERDLSNTPLYPLDSYYLGVDVARMGGDETTYEIFRKHKDRLIQLDNIIETDKRLTHTTNMILALDRKYDFEKIYIDDGGLGVGIYDVLLDKDQTRRKIIPLNNAQKSIDIESKHRKILKEDMYINLRMLMEKGRIDLLQDNEIFTSLKSIVYETNQKGKVLIHGRYSHITEGIIRAAWCMQGRHLELFCEYI